MKIIIAAAALLLTATSASAQTVCFPGDHHCQHMQNHQRFNESFFGNSAGIPQGPGLLDILAGIERANREQQEHELRMKLMQEQLRMIQRQSAPADIAPGMMVVPRQKKADCDMGIADDGSCWRPSRVGAE